MTSHQTTEIYGWIGILAVLGAYAAVNFHWLEITSITYCILNAFGALGIVLDAAKNKAWPPAVLNGVWFLIALYGIMQFIRL